MALRIIFLEEFGKAFVPKRFIPNLRQYLLKAGYDEAPYRFFGSLFYVSAITTTAIFILYLYPVLKKYSIVKLLALSFFSWFLIQILFAILFILLIYFYLDLKIFRRTQKMEDELPDFLQVLSSNLRGGMTFERALWASIKPTFAVLGNEMAKTSKKVMTGYETNKALLELAEKYDSLMLKRTVDLIISEAESGGNIAHLIDRIVDNLKKTKELKEEMSASAIAYIIFISVIVIVISPLLFALSHNLLTVFVNFVSRLSYSQATTTLPFTFSNVSVETDDFKIFSMAAIVIISFFSSLIVAIVEKGDVKAGVKYIPMYVFGALVMYLFLMKSLSSVFSGIL